MAKKSKYRESARGQDCMVRIPGICNGNSETTVLAHLNGGGMGRKRSDIHGAFACSACHDVLDGRSNVNLHNDTDFEDYQELKLYHYEGVIRTQEYWQSIGLLPTP